MQRVRKEKGKKAVEIKARNYKSEIDGYNFPSKKRRISLLSSEGIGFSSRAARRRCTGVELEKATRTVGHQPTTRYHQHQLETFSLRVHTDVKVDTQLYSAAYIKTEPAARPADRIRPTASTITNA